MPATCATPVGARADAGGPSRSGAAEVSEKGSPIGGQGHRQAARPTLAGQEHSGPHVDGPGISSMSERPLVQDLQSFRLPPGFRGRSGVIVQLWFWVRDTLFLLSPQPMYGWRRWLLRLFGATIGEGVLIRPTVRVTYPWKLTVGKHSWVGDFVELYTLGEIAIGDNVVVSQNSYLCAASHHHEIPSFDIFEGPITIESEAWVAADVFIGPGVTVGRAAVIGARSTLLRDAPPMMVVAGHPARPIGPRGAGPDRATERAGVSS